MMSGWSVHLGNKERFYWKLLLKYAINLVEPPSHLPNQVDKTNLIRFVNENVRMRVKLEIDQKRLIVIKSYKSWVE